MQAIKEYAPIAVAVILGIGILFTMFNWVSGFGELKADVAHLDETVTRLEKNVDELEISVNELRDELRTSQDALRRELLEAISGSTAETAKMVNGHRHGAEGAVYLEFQ